MKTCLTILVCTLCWGVVVQAQTEPAHRAAVIDLRGEIDDFHFSLLKQHFAAARAQGADTIILQINTYGGLVTAGLDIANFLKQQPGIHIIGLVDEKAISAGAMIALACDELTMKPHALLGDCAPITLAGDGSLQSMGATERAKMESPILEEFRDSARRNGYPENLLLSMVSLGRTIHWVQDKNGTRRFVDNATFDQALKDGAKPVSGVRDPINSETTLLTLDAELATQLGISKSIVPSAEALAVDRGLTIIATLSPGAGEAILGALSSTTVRGILTTLFLFALYTCFSHPGHGAAEVLATVTLALLIGVPLLTGFAQWWEILAILAGIGLLATEVFVLTGFGVPGIAGVALLLVGLIGTFVGHEPSGMPGLLPHFRGTWDLLQHGTAIVTGGLICSLLLWIWLQRMMPRLPYFNRLILGGTGANSTELTAPETLTTWPTIGAVGLALTDLRPGGSAAFHDTQLQDARRMDVISESGFVSAGSPLVVREVSGNRIVVRRAEANVT